MAVEKSKSVAFVRESRSTVYRHCVPKQRYTSENTQTYTNAHENSAEG
jgi:hypothetical protein